jgi:hypothetical protein
MTALGFTHDDIAPCIFIKYQGDEMVIIAIYTDDLNIFETLKLVDKTFEMLNKTFKMKDLENQVCLGLQLNTFPTCMLLHQTTYMKRIFKQFNMLNCLTNHAY